MRPCSSHFARLIDIHPGDVAKTAQSPENDLVRSPHGDQAIPLQFRKFTGNGLDGETKVVGDVEASERNVDLDRRHGVCAGPPRDMEEEGGDPLIGTRPTKAHDLILRSRHFTGDLGEKLRAQIPAAVDQFMEAVPRKPSKPDRGHGFCRERIDVAERQRRGARQRS